MKKLSVFNMNFWKLFQDLLFAELYAFQIATTEMMTLSI